MVGIEKSNIYQDFKILYGLVHNYYFGGGIIEDKEIGAGNCMFEFSNMIDIMRLIGDKYVGFLSTEMILSLLNMCNILWWWDNNYEFLVDEMIFY